MERFISLYVIVEQSYKTSNIDLIPDLVMLSNSCHKYTKEALIPISVFKSQKKQSRDDWSLIRKNQNENVSLKYVYFLFPDSYLLSYSLRNYFFM